MCQVPENQLKLSRDRGTALICENKLVGILSVIIPPHLTNSTNVCTRSLRTHALYTKVSLYDKWIHSVMAVNSPTYYANGKPIPLVPVVPAYQSISFIFLLYIVEYFFGILTIFRHNHEKNLAEKYCNVTEPMFRNDIFNSFGNMFVDS